MLVTTSLIPSGHFFLYPLFFPKYLPLRFPSTHLLHSFPHDLYFSPVIGTYNPHRPYLTPLTALRTKKSSDLWSRHINIHCYLFPLHFSKGFLMFHCSQIYSMNPKKPKRHEPRWAQISTQLPKPPQSLRSSPPNPCTGTLRYHNLQGKCASY